MHTQQKPQKKTQIVGCRLPKSVYDELEVRCLEQQIKISKVLKQAVSEFLNKRN